MKTMTQEGFDAMIAEHTYNLEQFPGFDRRIIIENVLLSEIVFDSDYVVSVVFENVEFQYCSFKKTHFSNVSFTCCFFSSSCSFEGAHFQDCVFLRSRFSLVNLEAAFFDVNSSLRDVSFSLCNTRSVDFTRPWSENLRVSGKDAYDISTFSYGGQHFGVCQGKYLRIGCMRHELDWWVKNYKKVAKTHEYTADQRKMYGNWIKMMNAQEQKIRRRAKRLADKRLLGE